VSATPILERQAPFPPRAPFHSGQSLLIGACIGGAVLIILILGDLGILGPSAAFHRWMEANIQSWLASPGLFGILVISVFFAHWAIIVVHEGGHVLGGLAAGFRFQSMRVGPFILHRSFRVTFDREAGAWINGVANLLPASAERLAPRAVVMVLAGPMANLTAGTLVLLLPFSKGLFSLLFILFSFINGLSDLFPFQGRFGVSDGRRIAMLLRHREQGERWLAIIELSAGLTAGGTLDSMSPAFLAKAIAVRDPSMDTVTGHAFAYTAAMNRNDFDGAAELMEVCLTHAGHAQPAMREALVGDAALFLAKHRHSPDLAEQWLADLPPSGRPWVRTRVEAAILEARGDRAGALAKLDVFEQAILTLPNPTLRRLLLQPLAKWRAELRA
jgi:hypothetical protein